MNPHNRPRIVNANCWDKHMADAFSLTEPMRKASEFDLMHSRLNPESVSMVFASDGYSNAGGAVCKAKCDTLHSGTKCNLLINTNRNNNAKDRCFAEARKKRDACKADCDKKEESGGGGGILGTGIGSGRRKACKESGLTGVEKRQCARELKARGWKKGQPIPADMAGITSEDVVQVEQEPKDTPQDAPMPSDTGKGAGEKFLDDKTKNILIYSGIALAGIIGISVLVWGIGSAIKPPTT